MGSKPWIKRLAQVGPSERQLRWQQMEFCAFIHFGINTFTDREWGLGNESPALFNPTAFDAGQWVEVCKSAGMKGLILTCKHHDGFCLWPSRHTEYSVKNSPWRGGKGDVVREVAEACRRGGIKFGMYLSPWDRHEETYGTPAYNDFYVAQLEELLTQYGDVFCVWLDGACGEGPNGKRQVYDWERYYRVIRKLQPDAVIANCGPDVRWCGNEAGRSRASEWSVVSAGLRDCSDAARAVLEEEDLGSREVIRRAKQWVWYPAEVDVSIRPGWFWHASEDDKVKSLEELLDIYYGSVGGNASLLLNLPPDRRGLIHEHDARRLKELGDAIRKRFSEDLAASATAIASESRDIFHWPDALFDGNPETYWCPREGTEKAVIEIDLGVERTFDHVVLQEPIRLGQRVERFMLEYGEGKNWEPMYHGTVIGHKRICRFEPVTSRYIRLTILESRWYPALSSFKVYHGGT